MTPHDEAVERDEMGLVRDHASRLAARLLDDRVGRPALFLALTQALPGNPITASRVVTLCCHTKPVPAFLRAHRRSLLPPEMGTTGLAWTEGAERVLGSATTSEQCLLSLLDSERDGELDWYFAEAERFHETRSHDRSRTISPKCGPTGVRSLRQSYKPASQCRAVQRCARSSPPTP